MAYVQSSRSKVQLWQWPNMLAVDAVLIALCWQTVFALAADRDINFTTSSVLGLSVWLTYTADRLFDTAKRPLNQLHSIRHRFAKRHAGTLWKFWCGALVVNIGIALIGLATHQLLHGLMLLGVCLLYTGLNQKLSGRFFPKELCVAVIYAAGVIVFLLPASDIWLPAGLLMLLCLINCLIIGESEKVIDTAMGVRSIARFTSRLPLILYVICLMMLRFLESPWIPPFVLSMAALMLIHLLRKKVSTETFRIFADAALIVGPLLTFLAILT